MKFRDMAQADLGPNWPVWLMMYGTLVLYSASIVTIFVMQARGYHVPAALLYIIPKPH